MATELPSLSKELDKYLAVRVVEGEVKDPVNNRYIALFILDDKENANTPAPDLWSFHIVHALKKLAAKLNEFERIWVRALPLPEEGPPVVASFLSTDGKIPIRLTVTHVAPGDVTPEGRYMYFIETIAEGVPL